MKEIIKRDKCIKLDKKGFLVSNFNVFNIQKGWMPPIEDFLNYLKKEKYNSKIYSVYIRGSVATGTAIKNVSDIDFFVITKEKFSGNLKNKILKDMDIYLKKHPYITRYDIGYYTQKEILKMKESILIKLHSICIYGKDIKNKIPNLKPGIDTALTLQKLEKEIKLTLEEISKNRYSDNNKALAMCVWMSKRLLRAGFELIAEKESCFTRNLYLCWEKFAKYYPSKSKQMYNVLNLAINPTTNMALYKKILENLGYWILKEGKKLNLIEK